MVSIFLEDKSFPMILKGCFPANSSFVAVPTELVLGGQSKFDKNELVFFKKIAGNSLDMRAWRGRAFVFHPVPQFSSRIAFLPHLGLLLPYFPYELILYKAQY